MRDKLPSDIWHQSAIQGGAVQKIVDELLSAYDRNDIKDLEGIREDLLALTDCVTVNTNITLSGLAEMLRARLAPFWEVKQKHS